MPTAEAPSGSDADPHGFEAALARVGPMARRNARAAVVVAAALLAPDEQVDAVVLGRVYGHSGVVVLTDRRLLVVNDRAWKPDLAELDVAVPLEVAGWQDDRAASLTFTVGDFSLVVDTIRDRDSARELAGKVRDRVG